MMEIPGSWKKPVPTSDDLIRQAREERRRRVSGPIDVPVPGTGDPVRDAKIIMHRAERAALNAEITRVKAMDDTDPQKASEIARVRGEMEEYNKAARLNPAYWNEEELEIFRSQISAHNESGGLG